MNKLVSRSTFVAAILTISFLIAPAASSPAQVSGHAPDGGSFERIESVSILPKTGAPFSATVVTEWTRLLEDGTTTTVRNHRTVARDSTGRIFQERRFFSPTGDQQETRLSALQYSDPSRHEFYNCTPDTRTCIVHRFNTPVTTPTSLPVSVTLPNGRGTITREDLGQRTIDNLEVFGSREITTINPGANGYQHPEPTIKEFWYSPHLEVNLVIKRFEPRGGSENFALQNINLTEPNPNLFIPPADYKIIHADQ